MSHLEYAHEINVAGAVIKAIGLGCFSLFDASSSLAVRAILQILGATSAGLLMAMSSTLYQPQLPEV
jgi:hypothetical protein